MLAYETKNNSEDGNGSAGTHATIYDTITSIDYKQEVNCVSESFPLPFPPDPPVPSADTVASGPLVPAMDLMKLLSPNDWEAFVLEWADSLKSEYQLVEKCGGANDMGRDVIATVKENDPDVWDNYQCKHYDHPLYPSDIWLELGKAVYYSSIGEFTFPRKYRFVAPQGAGTTLIKLFKKPKELKEKLIENWDSHCRRGITTTKEVVLQGDLRDHLDELDFRVIGYIPAQRLIEEHRSTRWHIARFGGGFPQRGPIPNPPAEPTEYEVVYLEKLFAAYSDHRSAPVANLDDLIGVDALIRHHDRCRKDFYSAEYLRGFSRDTLPPGSFETLQEEVLAGVQDIIDGDHEDGYRRLLAVVRAAREMQLTKHALIHRLDTRDRSGICHQLANDREEVRWVD